MEDNRNHFLQHMPTSPPSSSSSTSAEGQRRKPTAEAGTKRYGGVASNRAGTTSETARVGEQQDDGDVNDDDGRRGEGEALSGEEGDGDCRRTPKSGVNDARTVDIDSDDAGKRGRQPPAGTKFPAAEIPSSRTVVPPAPPRAITSDVRTSSEWKTSSSSSSSRGRSRHDGGTAARSYEASYTSNSSRRVMESTIEDTSSSSSPSRINTPAIVEVRVHVTGPGDEDDVSDETADPRAGVVATTNLARSSQASSITILDDDDGDGPEHHGGI